MTNEQTKIERVTATRRRPQRFEDVIGQDFVTATLQSSIDKGKIANAYLFSGPRGCGKTSSARILAKALNCQKGMNRTPCGECDSCKAITMGTSFDVIEIDGASNTSVNDVRQIKDEVLFPPASSRYKIYIIDEVHMLSTSAFNALLKTIEEPPPYIVFIFATTELHKVPATIKSRCQQFNFRLVSIEQLKETLNEACKQLNVKAEDEALYWIAKEATGSVRDAYTLFDQVESFSDGEITMKKIQEKLGLTSLDSINNIFASCTLGIAKDAIDSFNSSLQEGVSIEQFIIDCASYLRAILLLKEGIEKESLLGYNKDRLSKEVLEGWNRNKIEIAFSIILQLYKDVRFSISPKFEVELALSRLSSLKDYVSPQDLKKVFEKAKNMLENGSDFDNTYSEDIHLKENEDKSEYIEKKNSNIEDRHSLKEERQNENINKSSAFKAVLENDINSHPKANVIEEDTSQQEKKKIEKVDSVEKLKALIIKTCEKENSMLSLTLSGTNDWEENDGTLYIYGNTSFDVSMLKNNSLLISKYVHEYFVRKVTVEILKEEKRGENIKKMSSFGTQGAAINEVIPSQNEKKLPKLVELVIEMFEGELLKSK